MILSLLIAAAAPSAVDAERDFARRAQTEGMWTAFRATAAEDAIMFVPQPTNAHEFLKDRKDPLLGYMWWPAEAYVSCDGRIAVTTGPSVRGSYRGYFTTVWARQPAGDWKWKLDHGDAVTAPRPAAERPRTRQATCRNAPGERPLGGRGTAGGGSSADGTLVWSWQVEPSGARRLTVNLWNGSGYEKALEDRVAAP